MTTDTGAGGGCARKLPTGMLESLLIPLYSLISRVPSSGPADALRDMGDAAAVHVSEPVSELATSADLLYPVSDDPETFGYIAGIHAMSDLFATFARPIYGTVTLGTTPAEVSTGRATQMLRGVANALHDHGAVMAGGHSVMANETFMNVAVAGSLESGIARSAPELGDLVVLSKPLGTGLALTARKLGVVTEGELTEEYAAMRQSNESVAHLLASVEETVPGAVRAVCDVSGFGFLDALKRISGSAVVSVAAERVPRFVLSRTLVEKHCWSGLADANLVASESYTSYEQLDADDALVPVLLNDPQTSGGLLAVVSAEAWKRVVADGANCTIRTVGAITGATGGPRIIVDSNSPIS